MTRILAAKLAVVVAAASLAVVTPPRQAAAREGSDDASVKRAQGHFRRGEKLFALGRFEDALAAYQKAFEEYQLPEFLFNIGQCHRNLGSYDEAIFSFRKYLRLKPDAENRDATEELIAELEAERARNPGNKGKGKQRVEPIPDGKPEKRAGAAKPVYKTWWFWTGLVVVAGAATTTVVILNSDSGLPDSDLHIDFPR